MVQEHSAVLTGNGTFTAEYRFQVSGNRVVVSGGSGGTSVTNLIERLAEYACVRFGIPPAELELWEHYPEDGSHSEETWDRVSLRLGRPEFSDWWGHNGLGRPSFGFHEPRWRHMAGPPDWLLSASEAT